MDSENQKAHFKKYIFVKSILPNHKHPVVGPDFVYYQI